MTMSRFGDLRDYLTIPQVTGVCLAPDGSWLAATVQALGPEPKKFVTSIWRIDTGQAPAARLTRSAEGESAPAFLPDGSLLFVSKRPGPGAKTAGDEQAAKSAVWLLPAGGEARRIAAPPGGVNSVTAARDAQRYLAAAPAFPGTSGPDDDDARRKARSDAGVSAILHETGPVRHWDHDLGPDCVRLLAGEPAAESGDSASAAEPRDLTPDPGRALDEQAFCLSPDGSVAVTGWLVPDRAGGTRSEVAVIDLATSERRTLLGAGGTDYSDPAVSPDGRNVVAIRSEHDSYPRPGDVTLVCVSLEGGAGERERDLLPGFDRRPLSAAWAADSATVFFTAERRGPPPGVRRADRNRAGHQGHDGRRRLRGPVPGARRPRAVRAARVDLRAARPGQDRPGRVAGCGADRERAGPAAGSRRAGGRSRPGRGGDGGRGRRRHDQGVAGAAGRRVGADQGAAAAVGARRARDELELVVMAMEPMADGRARLRRAAPRPGAVDRLRPGLHRQGPRHLG